MSGVGAVQHSSSSLVRYEDALDIPIANFDVFQLMLCTVGHVRREGMETIVATLHVS